MNPPPETADRVSALRWHGDALELIDQRRLPHEEVWLRCDSAAAVATAIRDMVVRGAPAIGLAAAYGAALAARARRASQGAAWRDGFEQDLRQLAAARPTAVNLSWALERIRESVQQADDPARAAAACAERLHDEDLAANHAIGAAGAALIEPGRAVLTHCNTGALATGGYGTALGVIRSAWAAGRIGSVYATETRPWLQGARLTAWELAQEGIPAALLADGAAASLLASGCVGWVIVGADRVAANGDVVNKIGTYALALAARAHGVGFMVAAPLSTVDAQTPAGADIEIEQRDASELTAFRGQPVAAAGTAAWNPVFDLTPAALVDALVTERGALVPPTAAGIAAQLDA